MSREHDSFKAKSIHQTIHQKWCGSQNASKKKQTKTEFHMKLLVRAQGTNHFISWVAGCCGRVQQKKNEIFHENPFGVSAKVLVIIYWKVRIRLTGGIKTRENRPRKSQMLFVYPPTSNVEIIRTETKYLSIEFSYPSLYRIFCAHNVRLSAVRSLTMNSNNASTQPTTEKDLWYVSHRFILNLFQ